MERTIEGQPAEFAEDVFRIVKETFQIGLIPQVAEPGLQVVANKDFFTGRAIEPESAKSKLPFARARRSTSRTLRAAGEATRVLPKALQLRPAKTEALLRGYFNAWAGYGLLLSDMVFFDDIADLRADQVPIWRRFFGQAPQRSTKSVTTGRQSAW